MTSKLTFLSVSSDAAETEFIDFQLSYSTADIAASIFYGDLPPLESVHVWPKMRAGTYYLLEGELRPIMEGAPPGSVPLSEESGLFRLETRPA